MTSAKHPRQCDGWTENSILTNMRLSAYNSTSTPAVILADVPGNGGGASPYSNGKIEGLSMKGVIRTRDKCAYCGGKFEEGFIGRDPDLVCSCGRTPRTYYIYLYVPKVGDKKITQDKEHKQLDSYRRASRLRERINSEIDEGIFDINDYLVKTRKHFSARVLIVKWYKWKCRKGLRPTTRKDYRGYIRNYFSPIAQKMKFDLCTDIRTHHIDTFFENLPSSAISDKTKDNIMTALRDFVNWLQRKEILLRNPEFPVIHVPRPVAPWQPLPYLMQAFPFVPDHDKPVIHFIIHHPPRSGEVCALRVEDFKLDKWIVHVSKAFSKNEEWPRKNNKPYYCPLIEHFDSSFLEGRYPQEHAFINSIGNHYTSNHLKKIWKAACEAKDRDYKKYCEEKWLSYTPYKYIPLKYAGRTRIASDAANRGESLYHIAGALGNTMQVAETNYAHLQVESLRGVIDGK